MGSGVKSCRTRDSCSRAHASSINWRNAKNHLSAARASEQSAAAAAAAERPEFVNISAVLATFCADRLRLSRWCHLARFFFLSRRFCHRRFRPFCYSRCILSLTLVLHRRRNLPSAERSLTVHIAACRRREPSVLASIPHRRPGEASGGEPARARRGAPLHLRSSTEQHRSGPTQLISPHAAHLRRVDRHPGLRYLPAPL